MADKQVPLDLSLRSRDIHATCARAWLDARPVGYGLRNSQRRRSQCGHPNLRRLEEGRLDRDDGLALYDDRRRTDIGRSFTYRGTSERALVRLLRSLRRRVALCGAGPD